MRGMSNGAVQMVEGEGAVAKGQSSGGLEARLMALLTEAEDARAKVMDDMEVTPFGE